MDEKLLQELISKNNAEYILRSYVHMLRAALALTRPAVTSTSAVDVAIRQIVDSTLKGTERMP